MSPTRNYESIKFYIKRLKELKVTLSKFQTEYYPAKVSRLIASYKLTLIKILHHSEAFLRKEKDDWDKLEEVASLNKKYKKFLLTL
tara:strand:- start:1061 stop:1318 length:258 start_codon:yes stop_codon:yes gene_type:complete